MKRLFLAICAISLLAVSCKKDKKDCDLTKENLVGTYKLVKVEYKLNSSTPAVDVTGDYLEDCQLDDLLTLNSDNSADYEDAGVECSPNGDESGTWSLSGNVLTIDGTPNNIESFNCKNLVTVEVDAMVVGDKVNMIFQKQ